MFRYRRGDVFEISRDIFNEENSGDKDSEGKSMKLREGFQLYSKSEGLTPWKKFLTISLSIGKQEGMMQTTISSKYQVVIPKKAREHLNLRPKQKLTVIEKDRMLILMPQTSLDELRGIAAGAKIDDYREKKDRF